MVRRALLLCLGLWLIVFSGLSAHAGPCGMEKAPVAETPVQADHSHCEMMQTENAQTPDERTAHPDAATCCCPAILAALPAADARLPESPVFRLPNTFPAAAHGPTRTLAPEPYPPKA